ncbi:Phosphopantetheine attachment site, partial [Streptomyces sp. DvalAA-14]|uniref:phosphopantetheine-binding protein n=1 Tax=unclassified Streptomyces TaxID=2593676 RepID=UPI00081B0EA5
APPGAGADGAAPAGLRAAVAEEAAAVLRVPAERVLGGAALNAIPGFSSFRMVEIVERLEDRLDVSFDADDLVPENLHDIDSLCRIVRRARQEQP